MLGVFNKLFKEVTENLNDSSNENAGFGFGDNEGIDEAEKAEKELLHGSGGGDHSPEKTTDDQEDGVMLDCEDTYFKNEEVVEAIANSIEGLHTVLKQTSCKKSKKLIF